MMKPYTTFFLLTLVSLAATAQNKEQKERLTAVAENFIEIYNTGDTTAYKKFLEQHNPDQASFARVYQGYKNAFNSIGKVETRKITPTSIDNVELTVQESKFDSWWKFTVITDSLQHFLRRTILPSPFPADFIKKGNLNDKQLEAQLDDYITNKLSDNFNGNVLVARGNNVVYAKSFGKSPEGKANTYDQTFDLASMGKMFTAISILQLQDKKALSWDDKVEKFLPDLKNEAVSGITINQLLTHTSGMGDFFESPLYPKLQGDLKTSQDFLPFIEADTLLFEPGKGWMYSNTGFVLLGIVIEKVSGLKFEDYVKQHILLPAGMKTTLPGQGAGGGTSTVSDLYSFSTALLNNKLLSPTTTARLLSYTVNGQYGMGTEHQQLGEEHIVGHSGGFINVCTELNLYTKGKNVVIILSNSNPPFGHFLSNKIKELLVRKS